MTYVLPARIHELLGDTRSSTRNDNIREFARIIHGFQLHNITNMDNTQAATELNDLDLLYQAAENAFSTARYFFFFFFFFFFCSCFFPSISQQVIVP